VSSLTDFVVHGKIGQLFLGQSKQNILEILGEPKSWAGKPPCFGEAIESYKQSDAWHYYEEIVSVQFGEDETVDRLAVFVENIEGPLELFTAWPQMHGITMERWRLALKEHNLPVTESMDDLNFWILSGLTCIAICVPYPGGKIMPRWRRPVLMIQKVAGPKLISHVTDPSEDSDLPEFLVGLMYHDTQSYALWNKGIIEDYESTAGIFIQAETDLEALKWGRVIAGELLRHVTRDPSLTCAQFGYECWIEPEPKNSSWRHCLDFFQHVTVGQMPVLDSMTSDAYREWQDKHTKRTKRKGVPDVPGKTFDDLARDQTERNKLPPAGTPDAPQ